MEDLKTGDILLLINDNSPWEFIRYSFGKNTVGEDTVTKARPLFDKTSVFVKSLKPKNDLSANTEPRDRPLNLFKKAPVDWVIN